MHTTLRNDPRLPFPIADLNSSRDMLLSSWDNVIEHTSTLFTRVWNPDAPLSDLSAVFFRYISVLSCLLPVLSCHDLGNVVHRRPTSTNPAAASSRAKSSRAFGAIEIMSKSLQQEV